MSQGEHLIYTVRPDGTALWLPAGLAASLGIQYGQQLSRDLYGHEEIQGLIERRLEAEKGKAKR